MMSAAMFKDERSFDQAVYEAPLESCQIVYNRQTRTLAVLGTSEPDTIALRLDGSKITISATAGLLTNMPDVSAVSAGEAEAKGARPSDGTNGLVSTHHIFSKGNYEVPQTLATIDITAVDEIIIDAGDQYDTVRADLSLHGITQTRNVERRRTNTRVNQRPIDDFATAALPGQFAGKIDNWLKRHNAIKATAQANRNADLVFLGDSMLDYFDQTGEAFYKESFGDLTPLNLALAGDTTSQLLYRINDGLLDGLRPKVVVLAIGTNNVGLSDDPDQTARGIAAIIAEVRKQLPQAKIILSSVLPRLTSVQNKVVNKLNDRLAQLADGNEVRFVDATSTFSGKRARAAYYRPGNLHLHARGYRAWARLLEPAVREAIADVISR